MSEYLVKTVTGEIASFSNATPNLPLTDAKFPIAPATQSSGTPAPPGITRNLYPSLNYETRTWPYKLTLINMSSSPYSSNENELTFWPAPLDYASYNVWMGFEFAEDSFAYKISSLFEDQVRSISVTMFVGAYYSDANLKFKLVSGDNEDVVTVPSRSSDQFRLKVHTTAPDLKILVLQEDGGIGAFSIIVKDLQIEAGEIATDYISSGISYKPFIINRGTTWMGDKLYINHSQKNMIPFSSTDSRASYYGLSITVNSDGSIYVKGTATSNVEYSFANSVIPILQNVSYYLSGAPESSSLNSYYLKLMDRNYTSSIASDLGSGVSFSHNNNTVSRLAIYVKKNTEIDATFYPQLELGSAGTEYETWAGSKVSITLPTLGPVDDGYITLDGKIKSNRILILYDGSDDEEWAYDSEVGGYYISVPNAKNIDSDRLECRCDMGAYSSSGNEVGTVYITSDKRLYYIPPEIYNSIEKFKTFLEMFTITVNYETEKVEEVDTSYIPFTAFDGVNYLWCNNDGTEVSYYVSKSSTSYKYLINANTLIGIADKIREKKSITSPIEVNKFADEISELTVLSPAEEESF